MRVIILNHLLGLGSKIECRDLRLDAINGA